MMVLFQRKIIYMGYIPPGSRTETLADVPNLPVLRKKYCLEETQIQSTGRVKLSTLIVSKKNTDKPDCVVFYLQGNAGNPLHRIPVFESLLSSTSSVNPVVVAPAPRSYWSSTNRTPTERGILSDYQSALTYTAARWPGVPIVLYGHSLGGAIAICLLASLDSHIEQSTVRPREEESEGDKLREMMTSLRGLVLENPFSSIPDMVRTLYPQRWLPYHHLAPFAWDEWDTLSAMRISSSFSSSLSPSTSTLSSSITAETQLAPVLPRLAQSMLVLVSSKDEVVPPSMGRDILDARPSARSMSSTQTGRRTDSTREDIGDIEARLVEIGGALHEDAWRQLQWGKEMGRYLERVVHVQVKW